MVSEAAVHIRPDNATRTIDAITMAQEVQLNKETTTTTTIAVQEIRCSMAAEAVFSSHSQTIARTMETTMVIMVKTVKAVAETTIATDQEDHNNNNRAPTVV